MACRAGEGVIVGRGASHELGIDPSSACPYILWVLSCQSAGPVASPATGAVVNVVRDFNDPYLELLRLLTVAAEIEHGLMVQ